MSQFESAAETSPLLIRFEDQRVKMILRRFHLLSYLTSLLNDYETRHGYRRLTLESFFQFFPTFPILLAARLTTRVAERLRPVDLFRHFEAVFLFQRYVEVYSQSEEEANGRPIGMVMPFDGFRGGMVIHNGHFDTGSTKMIHHLPDKVAPYQITVEPFARLLRFLVSGGWTPSSPMPSSSASQKPPAPEIRFTPALLRKLGAGPEMVIYSWLLTILRDSSHPDCRLIHRISEQARGVAATHEQIAAATGLSERQVKRAMSSLIQGGILGHAQSNGKRCIGLRKIL